MPKYRVASPLAARPGATPGSGGTDRALFKNTVVNMFRFKAAPESAQKTWTVASCRRTASSDGDSKLESSAKKTLVKTSPSAVTRPRRGCARSRFPSGSI